MAEPARRLALAGMLAVFCLSGFASLVYEIVWLKTLRDLFGNAAHATAATLAVFFLGLSAGSLVWGRRAGRLRSPIGAYALLELAVAGSALAYPAIHRLYEAVYPALAATAGDHAWLQVSIKGALALALLFPPAFFMGGTLPLVAQALVRRPERLARNASALYAINTVGAAAGALAAGFLLPPVLGYRGTFAAAFALNLAIAGAAWGLRRVFEAPVGTVPGSPRASSACPCHPGRGTLLVLVFAAGFTALALEVIWNRLLSQVTINCVYSFALVLFWFLLALAAGGGTAHLLCRLRLPFDVTLHALLLAAAATVALSPLALAHLTDGLATIYRDDGFAGYVGRLTALSLVVVGVPGLVIGTILPYALRARDGDAATGRAIGSLWAVNTLGAIAGSILAGFVLLDLAGAWGSVALASGVYLLLLVAVGPATPRGIAGRGLLAAVAGVALFPPLLTRPPAIRLDASRRETLVEHHAGSQATVSVVEAWPEVMPGKRVRDLVMRLNNQYTLGGVGSLPDERRQMHLPLLLHPEPRSVFVLGMATGITAGAALHHPIETLVVAELVPGVVDAARSRFRPYASGLFDDPRVTIVVDDGRSRLLRDRRRYDLIVADLFRPWSAGTGTLYTLEHFRLVRDRLADGGLFVQWLPLYQLTRRELDIIARTLLEVFPDVTLWRGNFNSDKPTAALVARSSAAALEPERIERNVGQIDAGAEQLDVMVDLLVRVRGEGLREHDPSQRRFMETLVPRLADRTPLTFYAANLGALRDRFAHAPLNTRDRPRIEYLAPRTRGRVLAGQERWLTSFDALALFEELAAALPPERDPALARLTPEQRGFVEAGLSYFRSTVHHRAGDLEQGRRWFAAYRSKLGLDRPGPPP